MKISEVQRAKIERAHFFHAGGGLPYQTCRFCKTGAGTSPVNHDKTCWWQQNGYGKCFGLFKYEVRHYICDSCRDRALAVAVQS